MLGKIKAPLDDELKNVKWGEYRLGDLFDIKSTQSFNTDKLVYGNDYDYVTRTSLNQGILKTTGFINKENLNESGVWSLGLLQMDFFYRERQWYAGQFVRKIIPKFNLTKNIILFFTSILNLQKPILLSVLVRKVNETFKNIKIKLPINDNNEIDYSFMESFISKLEDKYISELSAYLKTNGLNDYDLTFEEQKAIDNYKNIIFKDYNITEIFDIKNTKNILSRDIVLNSGTTPYLCASCENNSVSSYIDYDKNLIDKGNCIFIGGKTFVVSYQEKDFYSNDSHNLALYLKDYEINKYNGLYLATCIEKSLSHKYSWGNSVSNDKIKKDTISLPVIDDKIDMKSMEILISAIQKLIIMDVVNYTNQKNISFFNRRNQT